MRNDSPPWERREQEHRDAREELEEAEAVAGEEDRPEPRTTYRVHVDAFLEPYEVPDADAAETLARAGLTITATTEGQR